MKTKTSGKSKESALSSIRCTDEYVYFYSDKTPFSNWNIVQGIKYDSYEFSSSESLFMYLKAKVFRDDEMAERIVPLDPKAAKKCGRLVRPYSDEIWERERENAMYIALKAKMEASGEFRAALLKEEYRGKTFVEASPYDKIWGIKQSVKDAYEGAPWRGLNLLGKLLTELRDETLGLTEPQNRDITPITNEEMEAISPKIKPSKAIVPAKNTYNANDTVIYSILGGIIGDIVGSSREGYNHNTLSPRKLLTAKSYFTDDTVLTIAVADWLNDNRKDNLSTYLLKWSVKYPYVGYGGLYKEYMKTGAAQDSNGNGGAMRVAPCAVAVESLTEALQLAEEQCKVTHTTSIAIDGAKAIAAAVYIAKEEREKGTSIAKAKERIKLYIEDNFGYDLSKSLEDIQAQSVELAKQRDEFRRTGKENASYMNMSNASLSCPMAITAFLLGGNFEESIRYALAMMGDADTIACMAGCISAQLYGIPKQLVDDALVYLPMEMVEVLRAFEPNNNIVASRITPPEITKWTTKGEVVVYGSGDNDNEQGRVETVSSRFNPRPRIGYPIPTIGKSLEEIEDGIDTFINYANQHPEMRFHIRKVGYDKAGYTIEQIAPLFNEAKDVKNILLPKEIVTALNW